MKTGMRILAVAVALLMLMTGPLAPIAFAQQPPPAQPEPIAQQPTPPPMPPPEPAAQQPAAQPMPPPEPTAQQPAPQPMPPPEPTAQQPAPQPMPPPEPAAQQPTAQPMPEPMTRESRLAEAAAYNVGAGIANVFYIPGKGILCAAGVASGVLIMLFTIGSAPRPAAYFAREGCGGRWYLVGDDLRPESEIRAFDWERDGTIRF